MPKPERSTSIYSDMRGRTRVLARTLRDTTSDAEVAYVLHAIAIEGRDPGVVTREMAEEACRVKGGGPLRAANGTSPSATIPERLVALKMWLDRAEGASNDRAGIEDQLRRAAEAMTERPDLSALSDEELETYRFLKRKAVEAARLKSRGGRVQAAIDQARAAGAE